MAYRRDIIKINEKSYSMLKEMAKWGESKKAARNKGGYYYITVDKDIYDNLRNIADDMSKAIFYLYLDYEIEKKRFSFHQKGLVLCRHHLQLTSPQKMFQSPRYKPEIYHSISRGTL